MAQGLTGKSSNLSETDNPDYTYDKLSAKITAAGGNTLRWLFYWSSTEVSASNAYIFDIGGINSNRNGSRVRSYAKNTDNEYTHVRMFFAFSSATAAVYTISYNANGGSSAPSAQTKDGGIDLTLSSTVPTRTGYAFAGWNTQADGSGTSYASGATFTDNANTTLYAQWTFQGSGSSTDPYLIPSADVWNYLADKVSAGNTYSEKYFQLTEDIGTEQEPITRMIGIFSSTESDCRPFSGTFDGNGHTLTVNYSSNDYETRTALFSYVKGATIKNLIVTGNCGTAGRAAGIVGECSTLCTVTNCVSSVTISGGPYIGGISIGGNYHIEGCLFNGTINGTSQSGGFVGHGENNTKITNCLFAPQDGSSISGGTFYFTGSGGVTITNSYYTRALGTAQGKQARSISAGDDITISNLGAASATYDVSGITAYAHGIKYNDVFYAGNGDAVSLNLSHTDKAGYTFSHYAVTGGGTLSAQTETSATLTMTDANQTINVRWGEDDPAFPLMDSATFDLSTGFFGNTKGWEVPSYESANKNIGYVREGGYADGYYVYNGNATAYYSLYVNIPWFKNSGTFTVTITDVATNTTEATATSPTITGLSEFFFTIANPITPGVKKIRFDFHSANAELNDHLYNINNVSFYRRSLNEDDDYTPIPATGVDVVLGRTLNAGGWNTFCVPFNISSEMIASVFGENTKVRELNTSEFNSTTKTLTLNFTDATSIEAGKPYLVKVDAAVANPTFDDVTIVSGTTTTETTYADFVPVMNPTSLTGGDKSILFVTGGDKLTYPNTTGNINGFRAYFQLHDLPNEARSFAMSFDDETTAVRGIENGELRVENSYYDLQGRRVVQPTKGLYIVNGKKLIIK